QGQPSRHDRDKQGDVGREGRSPVPVGAVSDAERGGTGAVRQTSDERRCKDDAAIGGGGDLGVDFVFGIPIQSLNSCVCPGRQVKGGYPKGGRRCLNLRSRFRSRCFSACKSVPSSSARR